jgi:5-methyltetrahydrofolate--homocysteine methyltransferase
MSTLEQIKEAVVCGDAAKVQEYTERAVAEGIEVAAIVNEGLIAGMSAIGAKFKNDEVFVPEVMIAARAMHVGMDILRPLIAGADIQEKTTVVIGTVKEDLHDIGKNLVVMMLEGAGYKVIDLGINVPPEKFIDAVQEYNAQIVGLSALLTTTMVHMKTTLEDLKSHYPHIKIMVGGAPVTDHFAKEINADGFASDAASAVDLANELSACL